MALLLIAMTSVWAQDNVTRIVASGTSDVYIGQSDTLLVVSDDGIVNKVTIFNKAINLTGTHDYVVTLPELKSLELYGTSDAKSSKLLKGDDLFINMAGASDAFLNVDYDSINVMMAGTANLTLTGRCRSLYVSAYGACDINTISLEADTIVMNLAGTSEWENGKDNTNVSIQNNVSIHRNQNAVRYHETLLYDAQWDGFEAGLNILTPGNLPEWMGLRQMRSWCFNINIADVGIAFNRQHSMGIFTGVGIGWNNYSFNKPMFFEKDAEGYLNATPILDEQGLPLNIERSKIGVFYAQMPLMIEFKPFRQRMYIDLGVTCGMRITSWQTIEFGRNYGKYAILGEGENAELIAADKTRDLQHKDLCVNFFKVDATLRAGSVSDDIGFFVKYSLLPLFTEGKVKDADGTIVKDVLPLNIGFSINF